MRLLGRTLSRPLFSAGAFTGESIRIAEFDKRSLPADLDVGSVLG